MNPFMQPMAWQCGCIVNVDAAVGNVGDPPVSAIRKTQPGTKTLCGYCGMRRPTS